MGPQNSNQQASAEACELAHVLRGAKPKHVHVVTRFGKQYASFQRGRGTRRPGPRVKLPWPAYLDNGEPDPRFWEAYAQLAPEEPRPPLKRGAP
jgi:hypothetical protein